MNMFRRPTKKQQLIRRVVVSVVSVMSIIVIATGTILFILGYRLDSEKGQLEQGALLQFESLPSGALVSIDGKATSIRTPGKQSVIAGTHSFIVSRDGYQPWAKSLTLKSGTLTWLDYVRLVPKTLKTETVATYQTIYGEKASPDNRSLIIQEKADTPTFQLIDLRAQDIRSTTLALPATLYSEAGTPNVTHTFSLEKWDEAGRHVLIKHTYGDKLEWIVLDTQEFATSVNITRLLSIGLNQLEFSGTSGNILYGLTSDGVIRKLDLAAATLSRGLVSNVTSFGVFETNVLTYVGTDPANSAHKVAGIYREGDDGPHVLRTITTDTPLLIDATRYYNDDYVAIAEGLKITVLKGRYPSSNQQDNSSLKQYAEFKASANVDTLSFSSEGDFLVAQAGLNMVSFEIEHQWLTTGTISTSESQPHTLLWLDKAYMWATYDGHVSIREYDGTNVHVINAAEPGFDVTLSPNGRYLYSITKNDTSYQLQRVKMILD